MNPDFVEMLSELSAGGAEFLVVGAHALAAHGSSTFRSTTCRSQARSSRSGRPRRGSTF
jgi:hypothetical protein